MSALGDMAVTIAREERRRNDPGYTGDVDNRSPCVDRYLSFVGRLPVNPNTPGESWCGDFVRWCYAEAAKRLQMQFRLPAAVSGGGALVRFGNSHPEWIVWTAGQPPCPVETGDIFVVANRSHVAMVSASQTHGDSFRTIEGNQTDPAHPEWGSRGIREGTKTFLGCAMILRPPAD